MAENVPLGHLHDGSVQEVEVTSTDGRASDLEDHIAVLDDLGLGDVGHLDLVLPHPHESFHRLGGVSGFAVVRNVLLYDGIVAVANGLFDGVGRLRYCHIVEYRVYRGETTESCLN